MIVSGEGSQAHAKLRARCRSERLLYLTFARATSEIRLAGEEAAQRGVVVTGAERLSDLEIEARVEWSRPFPSDKGVQECAAEFLARLDNADEVVVTHEAPRCTLPPGIQIQR